MEEIIKFSDPEQNKLCGSEGGFYAAQNVPFEDYIFRGFKEAQDKGVSLEGCENAAIRFGFYELDVRSWARASSVETLVRKTLEDYTPELGLAAQMRHYYSLTESGHSQHIPEKYRVLFFDA